MKSTSIKKELLSWTIDHPDEELPESLRQHLKDENLRGVWEKYRMWTQCLRDEPAWTPDAEFYERMAAQAMREKRRAALTDSTRKDLFPDTWGLWSFLTRPMNRYSFATVLLFLLLLPLGYFSYDAYQTVGICQYADGKVLALNDTNREITKEYSIQRGTTIQTTQDSESIICLESQSEIVLAPRSRITFIDARTVRLELGKVYFDITPSRKGFNVDVPHGEVRVLGTAFSVEAEGDSTRVTVARGLVQVSDGEKTKQVASGQESMIYPQKPLQIQKINNIQQTLRWVNKIRDRRNQEELRTYYPSLAIPTPER